MQDRFRAINAPVAGKRPRKEDIWLFVVRRGGLCRNMLKYLIDVSSKSPPDHGSCIHQYVLNSGDESLSQVDAPEPGTTLREPAEGGYVFLCGAMVFVQTCPSSTSMYVV